MDDFDPADHDVEEVDDKIRTITDPNELQSIFLAERVGKNREPVKAVIREQLDEIGEFASSNRSIKSDRGPIPVSRLQASTVNLPGTLDWYRLRLKRILSDWFEIVGVILIILLILSGWLMFSTYIEPGSHTEQRQDVLYSQSMKFDYAAMVQTSNPVFPVGSTLANRPVYYTRIAPVLSGSFTYTYQSSYNDPVDTTASLSLAIRSVDRQGDSPSEYWRISRPLSREPTTTLQPGESLQLEFEVNMSRIQRRINRIRDELGSNLGRSEVFIVGRIDLSGTVDGQSVAESETYSLRIEPNQNTYTVTSVGSSTRSKQITETVQVSNTYSSVRKIGVLMLFFISVLGLGGIALARHNGKIAVDKETQEWMRFVTDRRGHKEWISTGSLPDSVLEEATITVATLEDLVDVAIDTDNRVIEDLSRGKYYVVSDRFVFEFVPPNHYEF